MKPDWLAVRYHLFVLIALLGCVAAWVTPRHFPIHEMPTNGVEPIVRVSQPEVIFPSGQPQQAGTASPNEPSYAEPQIVAMQSAC